MPSRGNKQAGQQRAGNADQNIADDAKAGATDDLTGDPARHQADEQDDQKAFVGQIHENSPRTHAPCLALRAKA